MKKVLLFFLSLIIGIAIFFWIGRSVGWEEIKDAFNLFTGWHGLVILGLTFLMAIVGTWKWKEILKGVGADVPFRGLIGPYLAGFSLMFLVPVVFWGGEVFRSYILKERNSIPWSKSMASVVIDRVLEWTANLTIVFLGMIFFILMIDIPSTNLLIIFGGLFSTLLMVIVFFYFKCARKESIIKFFLPKEHSQPLEVEKEIFAFFKPRKWTMWKAVLISFLRASVMYLRAWLLVLFLGKSLGALPILSILGFTYLAAMIPIPTSLGSHEALQTFAFSSLGIEASAATVFTMVIRCAELIISLIGILMFLRLGILLLKSIFFKKLERLVEE